MARQQERAREIDCPHPGLDEIAAVEPQPGEDDALRGEEDRLAHAESLRAAAEQAHPALAGDTEQAGEAPDVSALTAAARSGLEAVRDHDPELARLADRAAELSYVAADLALDLAAYAQDVDVDPARLAAVQDRRARLAALTRKYGPSRRRRAGLGRAGGERLEHAARVPTTPSATLRAEVAALATGWLPSPPAQRRTGGGSGHLVGPGHGRAGRPGRCRTRGSSSSPTPAADLGPDGADEVEIQLAANAGLPAPPAGPGRQRR